MKKGEATSNVIQSKKQEKQETRQRDEYRESVKRAIEHISQENEEPYKVEASREMSLYFTL